MKTTLIVLLMAIAAACNKDADKDDCIDEALINEEAVCTKIYQPVCGCDGKTYSNDCKAINSGVLKYEKGACEASAKAD